MSLSPVIQGCLAIVIGKEPVESNVGRVCRVHVIIPTGGWFRGHGQVNQNTGPARRLVTFIDQKWELYDDSQLMRIDGEAGNSKPKEETA